MHREGTDRNITPTTKQQLNAGSGTIPTGTNQPLSEIQTGVTPVHKEASMDVSPAGPSLRWNAFEDTLRQRREEVLQSSINKAKRADREPSLERERRKAG